MKELATGILKSSVRMEYPSGRIIIANKEGMFLISV